MHIISFLIISSNTSDPHEDDKMTVDGVMKFLEDLNLNPESRTVLLIAWKFKAATQCEFTKDEFLSGMADLGWVLPQFIFLQVWTLKVPLEYVLCWY